MCIQNWSVCCCRLLCAHAGCPYTVVIDVVPVILDSIRVILRSVRESGTTDASLVASLVRLVTIAAPNTLGPVARSAFLSKLRRYPQLSADLSRVLPDVADEWNRSRLDSPLSLHEELVILCREVPLADEVAASSLMDNLDTRISTIISSISERIPRGLDRADGLVGAVAESPQLSRDDAAETLHYLRSPSGTAMVWELVRAAAEAQSARLVALSGRLLAIVGPFPPGRLAATVNATMDGTERLSAADSGCCTRDISDSPVMDLSGISRAEQVRVMGSKANLSVHRSWIPGVLEKLLQYSTDPDLDLARSSRSALVHLLGTQDGRSALSGVSEGVVVYLRGFAADLASSGEPRGENEQVGDWDTNISESILSLASTLSGVCLQGNYSAWMRQFSRALFSAVHCPLLRHLAVICASRLDLAELILPFVMLDLARTDGLQHGIGDGRRTSGNLSLCRVVSEYLRSQVFLPLSASTRGRDRGPHGNLDTAYPLGAPDTTRSPSPSFRQAGNMLVQCMEFLRKVRIDSLKDKTVIENKLAAGKFYHSVEELESVDISEPNNEDEDPPQEHGGKRRRSTISSRESQKKRSRSSAAALAGNDQTNTSGGGHSRPNRPLSSLQTGMPSEHAAFWDHVYWLDIDYVSAARLAVSCGALFCGWLYLEYWYEEHFKALRLGVSLSAAVDPSLAGKREADQLLSIIATDGGDPDLPYAMPHGNSILTQLQLARHEKNWPLTISNLDAMLIGARPEVYASVHEQMLRALLGMGCDGVAQAYLWGFHEAPLSMTSVRRSSMPLNTPTLLTHSASKPLSSRQVPNQISARLIDDAAHEASWRLMFWDDLASISSAVAMPSATQHSSMSTSNQVQDQRPIVQDTGVRLHTLWAHPLESSERDRVCFHGNIVRALGALKAGMRGQFERAIHSARAACSMELAASAGQAARGVNANISSLQMLEILQSAWDTRSRATTETASSPLSALRSGSQPRLPRPLWLYMEQACSGGEPGARFDILEPLLALEATVARAVGSWAQIPDIMHRSASAASEAGNVMKGQSSMNAIRRVVAAATSSEVVAGVGEGSLDSYARPYAKWRLQEAELLWQSGQHQVAIHAARALSQAIQSTLDNDSPALSTRLPESQARHSLVRALCLAGKWLAETKGGSTQEILEDYLVRACEISSGTGLTACEAHYQLAFYVDNLYLKIRDQINGEEWKRGLAVTERKKRDKESLERKLQQRMKEGKVRGISRLISHACSFHSCSLLIPQYVMCTF